MDIKTVQSAVLEAWVLLENLLCDCIDIYKKEKGFRTVGTSVPGFDYKVGINDKELDAELKSDASKAQSAANAFFWYSRSFGIEYNAETYLGNKKMDSVIGEFLYLVVCRRYGVYAEKDECFTKESIYFCQKEAMISLMQKLSFDFLEPLYDFNIGEVERLAEIKVFGEGNQMAELEERLKTLREMSFEERTEETFAMLEACDLLSVYSKLMDCHFRWYYLIEKMCQILEITEVPTSVEEVLKKKCIDFLNSLCKFFYDIVTGSFLQDRYYEKIGLYNICAKFGIYTFVRPFGNPRLKFAERKLLNELEFAYKHRNGPQYENWIEQELYAGGTTFLRYYVNIINGVNPDSFPPDYLEKVRQEMLPNLNFGMHSLYFSFSIEVNNAIGGNRFDEYIRQKTHDGNCPPCDLKHSRGSPIHVLYVAQSYIK